MLKARCEAEGRTQVVTIPGTQDFEALQAEAGLLREQRDRLMAAAQEGLRLYRGRTTEPFSQHGHYMLMANDPDCGPWVKATQAAVDAVLVNPVGKYDYQE